MINEFPKIKTRAEIEAEKKAEALKEENKYLQGQVAKILNYSKKSFVDSVIDGLKSGKKPKEAFRGVLLSSGRLRDYDLSKKPFYSPLEEKLYGMVKAEIDRRAQEKRRADQERKSLAEVRFSRDEYLEIARGAKAKELHEARQTAGKGLGMRRLTTAIKQKKVKETPKEDDKQLDLPFET